jgi:hypothetical protein
MTLRKSLLSDSGMGFGPWLSFWPGYIYRRRSCTRNQADSERPQSIDRQVVGSQGSKHKTPTLGTRLRTDQWQDRLRTIKPSQSPQSGHQFNQYPKAKKREGGKQKVYIYMMTLWMKRWQVLWWTETASLRLKNTDRCAFTDGPDKSCKVLSPTHRWRLLLNRQRNGGPANKAVMLSKLCNDDCRYGWSFIAEGTTAMLTVDWGCEGNVQFLKTLHDLSDQPEIWYRFAGTAPQTPDFDLMRPRLSRTSFCPIWSNHYLFESIWWSSELIDLKDLCISGNFNIICSRVDYDDVSCFNSISEKAGSTVGIGRHDLVSECVSRP